MTTRCPDLDTLLASETFDESRRHLSRCADCAILVELAAATGGEGEPTAECDEAELLIAALGVTELRGDDRDRLDAHLGECARCRALACAVMLDVAAPEVAVASGPVAEPGQTGRPAWLWIGAPVVAVAAATVLVLVLMDDREPETAARLFETQTERIGAGREGPQPQPAPAPDEEAPDEEAPDEEAPDETLVARNAKFPDAGPASLEYLDQDAIQAAASGDGPISRGFEACNRIEGNSWSVKCVALACRYQNPALARTYLQRVEKRATRDQLRNLCLGQGVDVGSEPEPAPGPQAALEADIEKAMSGGSITKGFLACNKVRGLKWLERCVVLACRNQNRSRSQAYIDRLPTDQLRERFASLCRGQGVRIEVAPADPQARYQQDIEKLLHGGSPARAYAACDKVRGLKWVVKCVVLACRDQNKIRAQAYLNRITDPETHERFVNLCRGQGVTVR